MIMKLPLWIKHPITFYFLCMDKNLSSAVSNQISKKTGNKFICGRCLNYFSSEETILDSDEYCSQANTCKISFPKQKHVEFTNYIIALIIYTKFLAKSI